jgi:hypothetical protein
MRFVLFAMAALCFSGAVAAAELEGQRFDDGIRLDTQELKLNGLGLRTRFTFRVYVAGLYVTEKKTSAAELIEQKGPKRIALRMMRELSAPDLLNAFHDGLQNNHSGPELAALASRIEQLDAAMKLIGSVKAGDLVTIDFLPGRGTHIAVNGAVKGATIAGEDFYAALMRIWLGEKPADRDLKKGLLGQS